MNTTDKIYNIAAEIVETDKHQVILANIVLSIINTPPSSDQYRSGHIIVIEGQTFPMYKEDYLEADWVRMLELFK